MSPHSPYDPLDSRGSFIIQLPSVIYIWVGRQCEAIMERDVKAAVCQIARYEKVEAPIMVAREGEEPAYYWDVFTSILPIIKDSMVRIQPGDRKVDAYNLDFEIFQKAIEGGFVPTLATSNSEHETHFPARKNSWSSLKCKFASRFEKNFVLCPKTPLSRVYYDSIMIVHSSASHSSTTSSSSASSLFLSLES